MPGNIQPALPLVTLPKALASAYAMQLAFETSESTYKSGEYQSALLVDNARRSWMLARKLLPAQTDALLAFYLARGGAAKPFWFYDPFEPATGQPIGSNWSSDGSVIDGRYCVRFKGPMSQNMPRPGRQVSEFTLVELAGSPTITTASLSAWTEYVGANGLADLRYSVDGGASFSGVPGVPSTGAYSLQQTVATLSSVAAGSQFQIVADCAGTLFSDGPVSRFRVYDLKLTVTYIDGTSAVLRPRSWIYQPNDLNGAYSNPGFAYDTDTTPPATYAEITRSHFSGIAIQSALIFTNWQ